MIRIWNPVHFPNSRREKAFTREQVERKQAQAVRAAEDLRDDPALADELAELSVEEYAERKHIQLVNPKRKEVRRMAKQEHVVERLDALAEKVESLTEAIMNKEKPAQKNPTTTRTIVLPPRNRSDRVSKRLRKERDKILDSMEDVQAALDEGQYDEAADLLDEVLDEYETEGENGSGDGSED